MDSRYVISQVDFNSKEPLAAADECRRMGMDGLGEWGNSGGLTSRLTADSHHSPWERDSH